MSPKKITPYPSNWLSADSALDAVQEWASCCHLLRETGQIVPNGRIDGVLLAKSWAAKVPAGLVGIEVKVSRSDFLRGLNSGQFEKYDSHLTGLFVAAPHGVYKMGELPNGIGALTISRREGMTVCVCRRKPAYRAAAVDSKTLWAVIWDLLDQEARDRRELLCNVRRYRTKVASLVSSRVFRAMGKIERECLGFEIGESGYFSG